ncbi:4-nitrophenyl phosphatase [Candidatus Hakubella thermalkaliphila]|uniref:4-nitrophenyl phosphatase n=1 Tax=Candidatus Hakubella thermalkaliphila TaxID=2754717 RepID=A0A6V8NGB5_9ACTN|nr:HAD-IIA family hydrolase [Candidatus Hakubella thermalkaliphila]GFP19097.1 4-nitrophenyl phosphatase [Candidatus Hakubella thermalkaliphila]GFP31163.1 4-nitrophenyl phosphatase [Candidatus Hakubella thermalkaliphila]GFP37520.1 4-nitrophenyl phosphatase [Candidatus Hakubella thermalkaliphila]GFP40427.1 4-nitrophenyl phosphatase [Candidatus Hakubella thermalkaliphila]GFP42296.1 4-nitrophenyl phosphatase [Candidatus Hakubella thermalkaliphila]
MGLLEKYDNFIFDMDGVIYIEDRPIKGAKELFQKLKDSGKRYVFMTNNSQYSVPAYLRRLKSMGIEVEPDQIISSARVTAHYVRDTFGKGKVTTYVIGSNACKAEMEQAGIKVLSGEEGKKADLVIVGLDVNFSYKKLRIASLAIRNGAAFIVTNADATFPGTEGVYPGAGSLIAALEASTGQKATSIGKPARPMLDAALKYFGNNGQKTLIVGDRLDTDILMGNLFGIDTAMVLTGIHTRKDVESSSARPTYILDGIWSLLEVEGPGPMARGVPYQEEIFVSMPGVAQNNQPE